MQIQGERANGNFANTRVVSSSALNYYWALFLVANVLLLLPIWLVKYIPMVDYPSHLARMNILYHHQDIPAYAQSYEVKWEPIPNLAMDVIVPFFMNFVDVFSAGKLFVSLTVLLFSFGCHYLALSIHKKSSWITILLCFLNINLAFLMGFLNYIFGFGLFLIALAFWLRHCRHGRTAPLLMMAVLTTLCYFAHLSAYTFLGASVGLLFLQQFAATRKLTLNMVLSVLPLTIPLIVFLTFMKGSGQVGEIEWSSPFEKVKDIVFMVRTYDHVFDGIVVFAAVAVLFCVLREAHEIACRRDILTLGIAFFLFFLACPKTLFTSWGADIRFLLPAMVLTPLAFDLSLPKKQGRILMCALLLLCLVRYGEVFHAWRMRDSTIATEVELFDKLPHQSKIFPLVFDEHPDSGNKIWQRMLRHTISYATITRATISPSLFALPGQQPIRLKDQPAQRGLQEEAPLESVNWNEVFNTYDYIWCSYITSEFSDLIEKRCERLAVAGNFSIYRIIRNNDEPIPVSETSLQLSR
jgi:hypothetical protein